MSQLEDDTVTTVKRTLRRKIQIPTYVDTDDVTTNRYQVYRGLSPDTSNRLEMKIKTLEESLEAEKQSKLSLEHEIQLLLDELQAQNEVNEELGKKLTDQASINRTKDQEFLRVRKEYELLLQENEGSEALMKRKFQDAVNDLSSQLESLNKHKNRLEGDKRKMVVELSEGSSHLESINAFKRQLESKVEGLEVEVKRLRMESEEKSQQLHDVHETKAKLAHEHAEVVNRLRIVESSYEGITRDKSRVNQEVEALKVALEEAESVKPHLLSTISALQNDLQLLKHDLDDESQAKQLLQSQILKLQTDLTSQKMQFEKELALQLQDSETQRKKLLTQITDADNHLSQQVKRNAKLEKDIARLNSDIKELYEELAMHKAQLSEALKRMKAQESLNNDQRNNIEQLQTTIEQRIDSEDRLQSEVSKLKLLLKASSDDADKNARELKLTSDALKEAKEETREMKRQAENIATQKMNADKEILRLTGKIGEGERIVSEKENQLYVLSNELKTSRDDLKSELRLKDEEIARLKRAQEKMAEESLRRIDEEQARHKTEVVRVKRVFEGEIMELRSAHEGSGRQTADLLRNNKSLNNRIKELEGVVRGLEEMVDDLRGQVGIGERKRVSLEGQLDQVQSRLDASEHARRNLDLSHQESHQQLEHFTTQLSSSQTELKRSEAELLSLKFLTDEFAHTKSELEDIIEKQKHEIGRLNEALNFEVERAGGGERLVQDLERRLRESKMAMEEIEGRILKEERKMTAKIASRCQGIEVELEGEQKKVKDLSAENRKLNKHLQEVSFERDAEVKEREERERSLESCAMVIAKLKKNLLEAEEVINLVTTKYKRLQQQFNDTTAEQLEAVNHTSHTGHTSHTSHSHRASSHVSLPTSTRLSISRSLRFGE